MIPLNGSDGGAPVFPVKVGDRVLRLGVVLKGSQYPNSETKSTLDLEKSICQGGRLKGKKLKQRTVAMAFRFAWSSFYPNTDVAD